MPWLLWFFCLLAESYETINHWPLTRSGLEPTFQRREKKLAVSFGLYNSPRLLDIVQALTVWGCCNPSWRAGNWSRQRAGWGMGMSGWSLEWVASVEVCRCWRSCILWHLRTTAQLRLIVLETDQTVTILTARGQTWQGRDSCSGLTQLVRNWESLAYLQLCSGSSAGRWWKLCSYRLAAQWQRSCLQ